MAGRRIAPRARGRATKRGPWHDEAMTQADPKATARELEALLARARELEGAVRRVFLGHDEVVEQLFCALFSGGHVLLEGVPGLGKTTLAKALAAGLDLRFRRVQFTPDLMPGDILGLRLLESGPDGRQVQRFERGPVFTHVLLADEINRASPRTQSALLEAMAEQRVTLFGETYPLEDPFFLVATENPIEMEGTFPLPEAQLDRFQQKVVLGRPSLAELVHVLDESASPNPTPITPVMSAAEVRALRRFARELPVARELVELVARTVLATHPDADAPADVRRCVRHGASPRAGQSLLAAARARALLRGRLHVTGEDLDALCAPVLRHRLLLGYEGEASGADTAALARSALAHARSKAP